MDIRLGFPRDLQVTADIDGFTVVTDQPPRAGGGGEAPTPFQLFLASMGTCAGVYYLGFLRQRGIPTAGAGITMVPTFDPASGLLTEVRMDVQLPAGFPEKYREAVVRAIDVCAVKRSLGQPPVFTVTTNLGDRQVVEECALPAAGV